MARTTHFPIDSSPTATPATTSLVHIAAQGETLSYIAGPYGVGVGHMVRANGIADSD